MCLGLDWMDGWIDLRVGWGIYYLKSTLGGTGYPVPHPLENRRWGFPRLPLRVVLQGLSRCLDILIMNSLFGR